MLINRANYLSQLDKDQISLKNVKILQQLTPLQTSSHVGTPHWGAQCVRVNTYHISVLLLSFCFRLRSFKILSFHFQFTFKLHKGNQVRFIHDYGSFMISNRKKKLNDSK